MALQGKKFKNSFIIILLILSIIIPIIVKFAMYSNNYDFKVTNYTMDVTIDEYGDMHVVEKISNKYSDLNTVFFKNLIYKKNNSFSSPNDKSTLVEDVRVIVEDSEGVVFDTDTNSGSINHYVGYSYNNDRDEFGDLIRCSDNSSGCEMIFYYDASGISKQTTFTYEYTIKGAVTEYKDISEFNWVLLDYQMMKVNNISISITLPDGDYDISEMDTFFHGTSFAKREFVDNNKILITANDLVKGEKIEARLLVDKSVFSSIRDNNKFLQNRYDDIVSFEEDQISKANTEYIIFYWGSVVLFAGCVIFLLILAIYCYKKYDKEFVSEFYNEYYRELPASYPPAVMGYLFKYKHIDDDDLTATLLDLIRRKYLLLENMSASVNDNNPDYTITLNKEKSLEELTELEKYLIEWFIKDIGNGNKVSSRKLATYCDDIDNARKYQRCNDKWNDLVEKEANKYDFFDESIGKAKKKFALLGTLGILVCVLLFFLYSTKGYAISLLLGINLVCLVGSFMFYITTFGRRSKNGNEDFVRWKAFKKFLEDFSNFEDYPVPSLVVWEHYLVYATSFGIADKVTSQLKLKFNVNQIEDTDHTFILYYGMRYNHMVRLNRTIRNTRMNAVRTISRYNSSRSGTGGGSYRGGGFSGGSSFGGGGGSFGGR